MRDYPFGASRFVPASIKNATIGLRPSVRAVLGLVDTTDPAWPAVATALREFAAAGIDLDATSVAMAGKLGKQRWGSKPADTPVTLISAAGSIVYYIRRGALIKIGTTTDPHKRFECLMPDEILAAEPGGRREESCRHRQFEHLRRGTRGEYFYDAPELLDHVSAIRSLYGDPDPSWPTTSALRLPWRLPLATSIDTLTAAEAEAQLGIKESTIRSWLHRGRLEPAGRDGQHGRRNVFYREHLIRLRDTRMARLRGTP